MNRRLATQDCAACGMNSCESTGEPNGRFEGCPMTYRGDVLKRAFDVYENDRELKEFARAAARVEATGYMRWTRVEDTMEFAHEMGYRTLGIASCVGLKREAAILESILKDNGFSVVSAICKTGGVPKEKIGLRDDEKVNPGGFEAMCNPVAQAMLLDEAGSELSVVLGLCVGHDSLFYKTSRAPVTTLVAKDRVLGHNPVAALYNHQSYYKQKLRHEHLRGVTTSKPSRKKQDKEA